MSTTTPASVIVSDSPQRIYSHAPLSTPFQRYLNRIGLDKKAQRLADIERLWKWYRASDDLSDAWRQTPFTSMIRTEVYFATRTAKDHLAQFAAFEQLIPVGGWFTRIDFVFYSPKCTIQDASHIEDQSTVRAIRKLASALLPGSIDKLGAVTDHGSRWNRRVKVLYAHPLDAHALAEIQSSLPSGVIVQRHIHPKSAFAGELRAWASADLPLDELERADVELFLHGLQQTAVHGVPKEIAAQFALEHKKPCANLPLTVEDLESIILPACDAKPSVYVPRSPKTGKLARFVSVTVDRDTQVEDILPDEWHELPLLE